MVGGWEIEMSRFTLTSVTLGPQVLYRINTADTFASLEKGIGTQTKEINSDFRFGTH